MAFIVLSVELYRSNITIQRCVSRRLVTKNLKVHPQDDLFHPSRLFNVMHDMTIKAITGRPC